MKTETLARLLVFGLALFLLFLGTVFLIAAFKPGKEYRFGVSIILFVMGMLLIIRLLRSKPKIVEIRVTWSPSGEITLEELRCPKCGASLPLPKPGQDYIKCPYCGTIVKIVEEPKW